MSDEYEKILAPDSTTLKHIRPDLSSVLAECHRSGKWNEDVWTKDCWTTEHLLRLVVPLHASGIVADFETVYEAVKAGRSPTYPKIERAMFEDMVRFEYCVEDCPDALARWVRQSLKKEVMQLRETLAHDTDVVPDSIWWTRGAKDRERRIKQLIDRAPENATGALPDFATMRNKVFENHPDKQRIYRLSYKIPSWYVHASALHLTRPIGVGTAPFALWTLINRAMRICRDRKLVAWEKRRIAQNIIEVCEDQLDAGAKTRLDAHSQDE